MPPNPTNLLQGTLDLLILKALALRELHGLGLGHIILQGGPAVSEVLRFGEQILPLLFQHSLRKERLHHEH